MLPTSTRRRFSAHLITPSFARLLATLCALAGGQAPSLVHAQTPPVATAPGGSLAASAPLPPPAPGVCQALPLAPADLLPCYVQQARTPPGPPSFRATGSRRIGSTVRQRYQMTSQSWSADGWVAPAEWRHQVDIYIPARARAGLALLVVNDGTRHASAHEPVAPADDFPPAQLAAIARASHAVVVSLSDVPNQALTFRDDGQPRSEDDAVAHSWSLYMADPAQHARASLFLPMTVAVAKAMDLAQYVLKPGAIDGFVVTGISKRGWDAWLSALADRRVKAIVPFAIDLLNTRAVLEHTRAAYGGNWPLAFEPYYAEAIDQKMATPAFDQLMRSQDPVQYLDGAYAARLRIPKYVVNASGDDFFVPDNARFYYDRLPGDKTLRVAPNASHDGIAAYTQQSLIAFLGRLNTAQALPGVVETAVSDTRGTTTVRLHLTQQPVQLRLWRAQDRRARDFRYACGIRYNARALHADAQGNLALSLHDPAQGWAAAFVEARFADGFVATSRVYVYPDARYPGAAPPARSAYCQTLPGR